MSRAAVVATPSTDRVQLTLHVALDPRDGSITGQVLQAGRVTRSFSGWVGLAAAIVEALPAGARPETQAECADEPTTEQLTRADRARSGPPRRAVTS